MPLYEKREQEKKDLFLLKLHQDNIKTLLLNDIKNALDGTVLYSDFLILKSFTLKENKQISRQNINKAKISRFNQYAVYIEHPKGEFILDLQDLKETIDKLLPKYISYKVAINKTNIAIGKNYNPKLTLKEGYNLDKDTSLKVELGIDPSSDYYIFNTEATHTRCLLTALLSSLIILISLFWVLRIRAKTKSYIANLESELSGKELMIQALNQNRQMDQALKLLFIKKATEMYIRKEVALNSFDKVILDSIEPNYFLFPLRLTDSTPSKVEVDKLERDIKEYFGYKLLNSQITFYHEVDSIRVPCSKEVFYQLIFSLLYNLLTGTVN